MDWHASTVAAGQSLMLQHHHIPAPPLSAFVELLWFYDGYVQPHAKERLLPDGSMEMVINLRDDRIVMYDRENPERERCFPGAILVGAHSEYFVIDTAQQASVIGIHFRPGGAFPFLAPPCSELRNTHLSLESLWGRQARILRERLLEAPAPADKFRVLEQQLLARLTRPLRRHPAVSFALREFHNVPLTRTVAQVSDQIGLSSRRFIQVFTEQVGLTPKVFCRIRRFQQTLRQVTKGREVDWAGVATGCGYFDQAHFIRDFRAFSGLTPGAYLARRTEHLNHVPMEN